MATAEKPRYRIPSTGGIGNDDRFPPDGGDDDDGANHHPEKTPPPEGYRLGMALTLVCVSMMFLALTSAYVVLGSRKFPLQFPSLFYVSTAIILGSSVAFEATRRALRRRDEPHFKRWITVTAVLGVAFCVTQLAAWKQLATAGFFVNTNHHSGFAYMFTGLHAAHLIGGLLGLAFIVFRQRRGTWTAIRRRAAVDITAIYWHFLAGLWLYLLVILFLWR